MKRVFILSLGLVLISVRALSQFTLIIEIEGLRNNIGKVMLQLLDINEKVIYQDMNSINERKCSFSLSDLKAGRYAVRYFHDENLNGNLNKNTLGKPKEGYGFSNNVTAKFGPPPFEKWLFEITANKKILLKPSY
jgi:uncharacterized protein (DUF2141 family)